MNKHRISNFDDAARIDVDLIWIKSLMIEFVYVKWVKRMAATVKNTPHFILTKVIDRLALSSLQDLVSDSLEGVLNDYSNLEHWGTHIVLVHSTVLD